MKTLCCLQINGAFEDIQSVYSEMLKARLKTIYMFPLCLCEEKIRENIYQWHQSLTLVSRVTDFYFSTFFVFSIISIQLEKTTVSYIKG